MKRTSTTRRPAGQRKKALRLKKKAFRAALARQRTLQAKDVAVTRLRRSPPVRVVFGDMDQWDSKAEGDLDRTDRGVGRDSDGADKEVRLDKDATDPWPR